MALLPDAERAGLQENANAIIADPAATHNNGFRDAALCPIMTEMGSKAVVLRAYFLAFGLLNHSRLFIS